MVDAGIAKELHEIGGAVVAGDPAVEGPNPHQLADFFGLTQRPRMAAPAVSRRLRHGE
jgi:hypothetical protein